MAHIAKAQLIFQSVSFRVTMCEYTLFSHVCVVIELELGPPSQSVSCWPIDLRLQGWGGNGNRVFIASALLISLVVELAAGSARVTGFYASEI